jgi:hypothetical protein
MMRPKLPGLKTCPVVALMLPREANKALAIGLAKFAWLKILKNSAGNSKHRYSQTG